MENNVRKGSLSRALPASVILGIVAAVLGTALHGQVLYSGDGASGFPLGAVGALVLSGATAVFAALVYRRPALAAVTGAVTYVLLGVFSMDIFGGPLIVTGTTAEQAPPIQMAGQVWLLGQAVATLAAVLISAVVLGRQRQAEQEAAARPGPWGPGTPAA